MKSPLSRFLKINLLKGDFYATGKKCTIHIKFCIIKEKREELYSEY